MLDGSECEVNIKTSVEGFDAVWRAVVNDFIECHSPGGLRISINDGLAREIFSIPSHATYGC